MARKSPPGHQTFNRVIPFGNLASPHRDQEGENEQAGNREGSESHHRIEGHGMLDQRNM